MDHLESIGYIVLDIEKKMSPERMERIEYLLGEINKGISAIFWGLLVVLPIITWRVW